jgi:hypothetical protein
MSDAVVAAWPELPEAIKAGIVAMAALVRGWRSWRGAALDNQKPYGPISPPVLWKKTFLVLISVPRV